MSHKLTNSSFCSDKPLVSVKIFVSVPLIFADICCECLQPELTMNNGGAEGSSGSSYSLTDYRVKQGMAIEKFL